MTKTIERPQDAPVEPTPDPPLPWNTIGILLSVVGGGILTVLPALGALMVGLGSHVMLAYGAPVFISARTSRIAKIVAAVVVISALIVAAVLYVNHRDKERKLEVVSDLMAYHSLNEFHHLSGNDGYAQSLAELGAQPQSEFTDPDSIDYVRYSDSDYCAEAAVQGHPEDVFHVTPWEGIARGHCDPTSSRTAT